MWYPIAYLLFRIHIYLLAPSASCDLWMSSPRLLTHKLHSTTAYTKWARQRPSKSPPQERTGLHYNLMKGKIKNLTQYIMQYVRRGPQRAPQFLFIKN